MGVYDQTHPSYHIFGNLEDYADGWDCDVCGQNFDHTAQLFCCATFTVCDWSACAECQNLHEKAAAEQILAERLIAEQTPFYGNDDEDDDDGDEAETDNSAELLAVGGGVTAAAGGAAVLSKKQRKAAAKEAKREAKKKKKQLAKRGKQKKQKGSDDENAVEFENPVGEGFGETFEIDESPRQRKKTYV